jgi:hypothetical protein
MLLPQWSDGKQEPQEERKANLEGAHFLAA